MDDDLEGLDREGLINEVEARLRAGIRDAIASWSMTCAGITRSYGRSCRNESSRRSRAALAEVLAWMCGHREWLDRELSTAPLADVEYNDYRCTSGVSTDGVLPLNRQSDVYEREGIDLDVSTLADWVGAAAATVMPLVDVIRDLQRLRDGAHAGSLSPNSTPICQASPPSPGLRGHRIGPILTLSGPES